MCRFFLALFLAICCWGCDRGMEPPANDEIVYSRDIHPLLSQKCATSGCHDPDTAAERLALDSWNSIFRGSEHGAMVIPFRADRSHLIFHVNTDSTVAPTAQPLMPPGAPLAREEVLLLMKWINEGAKNDGGEVAFASPKSGRIYVCNQGEDEVAVIDVETNLLIRMIPVGISNAPEAPHNVTVDPQGTHYYVNLITSGEIWKFSVLDDSFLGALVLGSGTSPAQIALVNNGSRGYVSNFSATRNAVQVFTTQTMQIESIVEDQRMKASHGIQVFHSGQFMWSANQASDNMTVIDPISNTVLDVVKVDTNVPDLPANYTPVFEPYQLVFTPNDSLAYVTCRKSGEVRVFSTFNRQLVKVISVGNTPLILDITRDGQYVYVANRGSNSVSVIRTSDNTLTTTIANVGVEPHGVAITKDGKYVYVSCENINNPEAPHHPVAGLKTPSFVAVINVVTNQVVKRIEVGSFGAGVAVVQ